MAIHVVETGHTVDFSLEGVRPIPLLEADKVRALLLNLEAGQAVATCQMSVAVLYYVIEGRGRLGVGDEQAPLQTGSLVSVPADAVRSISAAERMRILAVQVA
jgi:quercetin dioxygenase-like cupin family protein